MNESAATGTGQRLACIGGGNMARALLGGLLRRGWRPAQIIVSEPDAGARAALTADFGIAATADNAQAASHADVLLLAVKPQVMREVCTGLAEIVQNRSPLLISIAAGIRSDSLRQWLGETTRVIRTMPNTPALIGAGITALHAASNVRANERAFAAELLQAVGDTVWIADESLLDAVTAVSGSGPAYFFALMEAMIAGAIAQGLDAETARTLVLKTAAGAASLALGSSDPPAVLRQKVTSPGGTTQAALDVLHARGMHAAAVEAVAAATARGAQLSQSYG